MSTLCAVQVVLCCSGCNRAIASKYSGCEHCGYSPSRHATYFQFHCPFCQIELVWRMGSEGVMSEWPRQCPNCLRVFDHP